MAAIDKLTCLMQFFKDKGIKVVTVYPPATYTTMTTDRDDMEPVPEKEAQPSDVAKAAMLVSVSKTSPQCRNAFLLSPDVSEFRFPV